jgi:branched-chain amino acid transport system substrate-binding protein
MNKYAPALLSLFALTSAAYAQDTTPIKIGTNCTFEGQSAEMGISMRAALRIAVGEINAVGGIAGRKVLLVERDDKANPDAGKAVAEDLVNKERVVATIGYCNSGVAGKAAEVYQNAKVPLIIPVATGTALTKKYAAPAAEENYIFRVAMADKVQVEFVLKELIDKRGLNKIAVFADDTGYGEGGLKDIEAYLDSRQMKPVHVERFKQGVPDLSAGLQKAKAAGANAIFTYALGPDMATVSKGRAAMGWKVQQTGPWTVSFRNHIDIAKAAADGAVMPQTFIQDGVMNERSTSLVLQYAKANNVKNIPCPMCAAQTYDAMFLLLNAMFQAKTMDGPSIKNALENLNRRYTGVLAVYDKPFTKDDHEALGSNMLVLGRVKNGLVQYDNPADAKKMAMATRSKVAAPATQAVKTDAPAAAK